MKYDIEDLIDKGLIPNTLHLCRQTYAVTKTISNTKQYNAIRKIHKLAEGLKQAFKEISFDDEKDDEQEIVDIFTARYVSALIRTIDYNEEDLKKYIGESKDPTELLAVLQVQLDALEFTIGEYTKVSNTMIDRLVMHMDDKQTVYWNKENHKAYPELVIEMFAELYELITGKKPKEGDRDYPSDFEKKAKEWAEEIGFQENIKTYTRKLAKNGWQNNGLVEAFVIRPLLDMKVVPDKKD